MSREGSVLIPNAVLIELLGYPSRRPVLPPPIHSKTCPRCNGKGGWTNKTLDKKGNVISEDWVSCSVCGGTGSVS